MSIEDIEQLRDNRKWSQLCDAIIASIDEHPTEQLAQIFLGSVNQIHPRSFCEVFLLLSEKLSTEEGIRLLKIGLDAIDSTVLYSGNFDIERASLEIRRCLLLVELNETKDIERKLLEWKRVKMPIGISKMCNFLGFKLYSKIQNIENSLVYLVKYMELSPEKELMDTLIRYSLLSRDFFDFTSIVSLPSFEEMEDNDLKRIFLLFREGNIGGLEKCLSVFNAIFNDDSEVVKEKIYITALLNLCFYEKEKRVSFDRIEESLGISNKMSTYIVLKSFGLGLIKGWIDGENRVLYFSSVLPRALKFDEILNIKNKFNNWEKRVSEVISILK